MKEIGLMKDTGEFLVTMDINELNAMKALQGAVEGKPFSAATGHWMTGRLDKELSPAIEAVLLFVSSVDVINQLSGLVKLMEKTIKGEASDGS